ncbi:sodium/hydrogen exchanger 9B1 [Neophocaena asiaeorientalis asiaeorientalis]|uniref:Sodium/hydrogen exchanger 9B1 n=1 Tax=Neophocaena asiaeorientalis asiaeorientalis TaxID=1706337 RepID=A0A341B7D1_NEOAA|nr:sodium/hydrogen exchanger 9B1 [Neophocaena asiaeorientalis asiaeorientalis]
MLKEFMYTTDPKNEHLEDKNIQSSTTPQILKASDTNEHEETKETVLSNTEETKPQMEKKRSCPPQGTLNKTITSGAILFMVWCVTWSFSGPEVLPDGSLFGLLIIFYGAVIGGKLLEIIRIPSVPQLPPILGMLLAGFTIRNVPFLSDHVYVSNTMSSTLRNTALTIILVQAGLGLDPQALKHLKGVCLRLSMGPCLIEACSTAVVSHFLMNFPWQWGFLLGFVVGAVSPAVVVPSMLHLQEKGYGFEKGIPTLLVAASSLDDVVAISGFNTCFSIVFSSGGVLSNLLSAFRDVLIGVLVGIVLGMFTRYFPSRDQGKLAAKRASLILSLCVSGVLGSQRLGLHAAGGLCTLVLSFIAGTSWSKEKIRVQKIIGTAWNIFQPLLFGLVGAEVSVTSLTSNAIGICVVTLSLALLVRISFTFVLMSFAGFNFKEKIFIALSWMPKATVQAVLGPLALERARISAPHLESYSKDVMTIAFLAILITAPNGALIIGILGPKVLTRHDPNKMKVELAGLELH